MSIRQYLFIAISTLILTIAVSQLVLMQTFKYKIEQEINERGKRFADKIINYTLENIEDSSTFIVVAEDDSELKPDRHSKSKTTIKIDIQENGNSNTYIIDAGRHLKKAQFKIVKAIDKEPIATKELIHALLAKLIKEDATIVKGKTDETMIEVSRSMTPSNKALKKHFIQQMRTLSEKKLSDPEQVEVIKKFEFVSNGKPSKHKNLVNKTHFDNRHAVLEKMFRYISFIILVTSIVALLLVFWLSKKFSEPLQQLSEGFKRLESGDKQVSVAPQGMEEVKQTIIRFNKMSSELAKLAEAERQLSERAHLAEVGDVSKGLAHALRNPMHTLGLAVEQLQDDTLPETTKQMLFERINKKIKQLDKSIQALLTLTTGQVDRSQEVNLNTLIQDVILELKQSHLNGDSLKVSESLVPTMQIKGELNELRTVFHTLLFNAYEAAQQKQTGSIEIEINAVKTEESYTVAITDNGTGLNDAIVDDLFSPHVSDKAEGAGMGLYISKRIVQLYYHGDLQLENRLEQSGAVATLKLPIEE